MWSISSLPALLCLGLQLYRAANDSQAATPCRNTPGSPGFPDVSQWASFNASISGKLVNVVPFLHFCATVPGGCSIQQFTSSTFRGEVPGAMNQVNWEQDFDSSPPSLCQPHSPMTCGRGELPLYAVLVESASDIQAAVNFARKHNLRISVKASGHDYLGRSTARDSLLIWTHKLQGSRFTDNFVVDGEDLGPAVTLGSGVPLKKMYELTKAHGRIAIGGTASTVVAAGGFVQGGGHSSLSPTLGLAADNCLELEVVLANGELVRANAAENVDLFWAIRGGGAGSWGVIVSATFRTFPTFNAVVSLITLATNITDRVADVATVHAKHIFDLEPLRAGQYFYLSTSGMLDASIMSDAGGVTGSNKMIINTYFPHASVDQATTALQAFVDEVQTIDGVAFSQQIIQAGINDILHSPDDFVGFNLAMGSRLIPAKAYEDPQLVGRVYAKLLSSGTQNILANIVAGGQVAENAQVSNAVNPAWRTAKTHLILANNWPDMATIDEVHGNQTFFMREQLPILEELSGSDAGSYSNEADALEIDFQKTFFGPNYSKLSAIKAKYDPTDLFIVKAGVGSERWDKQGLCKVSSSETAA